LLSSLEKLDDETLSDDASDTSDQASKKADG